MNTIISVIDFRTQAMKKIDEILKDVKYQETRKKLIQLKKFFWANQR